MHISQGIHKIIAVSLVKRAVQQTETAQRTDAWLAAVRYAQENITCPGFLGWIDTHPNLCLLNKYQNLIYIRGADNNRSRQSSL